MQTLWQLTGVTLGGDGRPRLDDVSGAIAPGITAILGASGAGKTSLLNLLVGMEQPDSGSVDRTFETSNRLPIYWAPQGGGLWPHLSVRQHLTKICPDSDQADKILDEFDLAERQAAFPDELSQGEMARLSVARALAAAPEILLFDEPLVHVDGPLKAAGWRIIRRFVEDTGTSVILTTHEPDVVLREAQSVICLDAGRIVYDGAVMQLYRNPPDERCGRFLGPLNWFRAEDQGVWLQSVSTDQACCVRPECLLLQPANESDLQVVSSCFVGTHAETNVRHQATGDERVVIHRPATEPAVGEHVVLHDVASDSPERRA